MNRPELAANRRSWSAVTFPTRWSHTRATSSSPFFARTSVPVLAAELRLDHHADPARERPNHVEMTVDLDGVVVRARRSAPTMSEAIDRAETRLRRRVEAVSERPQSRQLRHRDERSWHHDDRPTERPHFYPRPRDGARTRAAQDVRDCARSRSKRRSSISRPSTTTSSCSSTTRRTRKPSCTASVTATA